MNPLPSQQSKINVVVLSLLSGIGIAILSLLIGTILDYIVVQVLSQYFLSNCSEDCYFAYFNAIFFIIALLSVFLGIAVGMRTYKRQSERS